MLNFSYTDSFNLMRAYAGLTRLDKAIIEKLFETDVIECTYSELAEMLNTDISNTRKSLLRLEKLGVVHIVRTDKTKKTKPMVACFLIDGWMEYLLMNTCGNGNAS